MSRFRMALSAVLMIATALALSACGVAPAGGYAVSSEAVAVGTTLQSYDEVLVNDYEMVDGIMVRPVVYGGEVYYVNPYNVVYYRGWNYPRYWAHSGRYGRWHNHVYGGWQRHHNAWQARRHVGAPHGGYRQPAMGGGGYRHPAMNQGGYPRQQIHAPRYGGGQGGYHRPQVHNMPRQSYGGGGGGRHYQQQQRHR